MNQTYYPAETHACQLAEVMRLLILSGSLTHTECEEATAGRPSGKITTLRSAIADIRADWGWGSHLTTTMESHGNGKHARYSLYFEAIDRECYCSDGGSKEVALNAISKGLVIDHYWRFKEMVQKAHPVKINPATGLPFNVPNQTALWTDFAHMVRRAPAP